MDDLTYRELSFLALKLTILVVLEFIAIISLLIFW